MVIFKIKITMKRRRKPALTKESAFAEMRLHVSLILMGSRAIDGCQFALKGASQYIFLVTLRKAKSHIYVNGN